MTSSGAAALQCPVDSSLYSLSECYVVMYRGTCCNSNPSCDCNTPAEPRGVHWFRSIRHAAAGSCTAANMQVVPQQAMASGRKREVTQPSAAAGDCRIREVWHMVHCMLCLERHRCSAHRLHVLHSKAAPTMLHCCSVLCLCRELLPGLAAAEGGNIQAHVLLRSPHDIHRRVRQDWPACSIACRVLQGAACYSDTATHFLTVF